MTSLSQAKAVLFGEDDRLTNRYLLLGGAIPIAVFVYLTVGATLLASDPFPLLLTILAGVFLLAMAASLYSTATDVTIATTVPLLIVLALIVFHDDLGFIHAWTAILALTLLLAAVAHRNNGLITCMAIGFIPGFLWMFLWVWGDYLLEPQPVWYILVLRKVSGASIGGAIIGDGSGVVGYVAGRLLYHVARRRARPPWIPGSDS